jgi:hypothetical protein
VRLAPEACPFPTDQRGNPSDPGELIYKAACHMGCSKVADAVRKALEEAAAEDRRPVSSYVEKVLYEHLRKKGYLTA